MVLRARRFPSHWRQTVSCANNFRRVQHRRIGPPAGSRRRCASGWPQPRSIAVGNTARHITVYSWLWLGETTHARSEAHATSTNDIEDIPHTLACNYSQTLLVKLGSRCGGDWRGVLVDQSERHSTTRNTARCTVYAGVVFGCSFSAASIYS